MPKDDQSELFYWVDENDQELGSITRKEAHDGSKKIHRTVYILLTNKKNQVLLQKRSMQKDVSPGKWTVSTSGHVTYGQSYGEAARREIEEEIGFIPRKLDEVESISYESEREKEIGKIFTCSYQGEKITPDSEEISKVKWIDKNKLEEFSQENPLTLAAQKVFKIMDWY